MDGIHRIKFLKENQTPGLMNSTPSFFSKTPDRRLACALLKQQGTNSHLEDIFLLAVREA